MKKATWKILMLAVLTVLLVSLSATALAGPADENNSFLFTRKGTLNGTSTASRAVELLTDAVNLNIVVNNNHTGKNGAEVQVDELRFKTWSTIPGAKYEQYLDAKGGPVTATYGMTNVDKGSYTVSVKGYETTQNVPFYISVSGSYKIGLNVYAVNLDVGGTVGLVGYYCADLTKTWTSSNPAVATVDADGLVTAKAAGTATITLYAEGQTVSAKIYVYAPNMADKTMGFNQTAQLAAPNSEQVSSVTWSSGDESIVKVDEKGKLTSLEKEGTATITATLNLKDSTTKTVTCKVTVKKGASGESASGEGIIGNMIVETGNWGKLHLRKEADITSQSLGLYPNGTVVDVKSNKDGWAKVTVGGKNGYMMSKYLKALATTAPESGESSESSETTAPGEMIVKQKSSSFVYLRSSQSTADLSNVIAKIPSGAKVKVISYGTWYSQIQYSGKTGYIVSGYLTK